MTKEKEKKTEKTWARCPCYEKRNLLPSYLFFGVFAFIDN